MRADAAGEGLGEVLLERARQRLAVAAAVAVRECPDIDVEQALVVGHPLSVLSAEARRAQLVVIGDRGTGLGLAAATSSTRQEAATAVHTWSVRGVSELLVRDRDGEPAVDHRTATEHECRTVRHKRRPGRPGRELHDCAAAGCVVVKRPPHRCTPMSASAIRQVHWILSAALEQTRST